MYGMLLESVQHFIMMECGEEIWETIEREAGARNTVFMTRQQYPDTLMFRLASALTRLLAMDTTNATASIPSSPVPRKPSIKSKPTWRSSSVHGDNRSQNFKCPFTATNALTAVTKKEIDAYNSSEEIRSPTLSTVSIEKIKEDELTATCPRDRRSLGIHLERIKDRKMSADDIIPETDNVESTNKPDSANEAKCAKEPECPSTSTQRRSSLKPALRKTSCTVALEVYQRRGSGNVRPRLNSLTTLSTVNAEKLSALREKFSTPEKVMHFFGRCFVKFFSNYGYDTMIRATGRYFCTFLQSVDSIHQRMRFTFPRMRSPSMQLTRAHIHGAELVYSSGRAGFTHYLMGQLYEIAEDIFSLKLKVTIVKESMEGAYYVAVLRLEFDNSDYVQSLMARKSLPCLLPAVPASLLLQLFPFGVLLDRKMRVLMAGDKLMEAWGGPYNRIAKSSINEILRLRKPKVSFTWDKVVCMQTVVFELELMRWRARCVSDSRRGSQGARAILLKGPIYFLEEIDALAFLCSPIFNDLDELRQAGLYLADMNGHGLSKEMLLQGWQHLSRLELLFDKAETRSLSLEKSCRLLDEWKKKGDQLLYSMIPREIATQLRAGKSTTAECWQQKFDCVTVMFCGIPLMETATRADVMQTVSYMNDVYSRIDRLLDSHRVYKVETVGTVYMVVSGAPEKTRAHAKEAASAALAVSCALPMLTIGVHSGPCQAAVLGFRQPRYCLVGDTVNTASRMQTTSEPGRIQISAQTKSELPQGKFRLRRRGLIKVKGKGMMETFWLEGEIEEDDPEEALQLFSTLCGDN
ncbi:soluble guanylate cyclase 89Db-like [Maniola jurtina]|uniref:soluble guanylate cyclase 89Db-like n=1 Tax=Maniola jurtina TaxID=191418 RepID=UPI001E68E26D|nr:soluble guanylate cyclase 89Db-like [Maniola jurtina]XP_045767947.1 soluble guanylate cyclase 89Db-like [Maniola jurtina]XP_045767948.1 soluble guanylate cyclase 89Db-like [Maniola jurtina]